MASFIVYGDASGQVTVQAPAVAGSNTITFPAETGTLVTTAYTGAALPGQIAWDTTVKTSGFTAVAYGGYFCNTTSSAFTVTLPATPTRGQFVVIVDYAGTAATNNITISPNGSKINGSANTVYMNTNREGLTLTYIDSTQGWLSSSNVYKSGDPFSPTPLSATYLVVAGGGAGGAQGGPYYWPGGGGGAGGLLSGSVTLTSGATYSATVGGGGTIPGLNTAGGNGSASSLSGTGITTVSTVGGGGGGYGQAPGVGGNGQNGGSGGGAGQSLGGVTYAGSGTPGQGYGGSATAPGAPNYCLGSGGGAGGAASSSAPGQIAGVGLASSITGTPATYATGGSGATDATPGPANTGTGGGGSVGTAGAGGSGVVILSVPTAQYTGITTGSPTVTTSGSNTIIKFTSSGTYTALTL